MTRSPYNRQPGRRSLGGPSDRQSRYPGRGPSQRGDYSRGSRSNSPPPGGGGGIKMNTGTIAVLAGVLVVGVGIGSAITSTTQGGQGNIASQQQLDMAVPDPEFCRQWGASAFVIDVEMYTTLNPSTSFVTQPALQPGCVIRRENWTVLQKQGAITNDDVRECKQRMNTFAYIGSIRDNPVVRCVYQADISENKFIIKGNADDAVGVNQEAIQF
ncbi:DUF3172 domain-containing protein [Prochlorococcus sp. MIT 1307]|uniref:DUF3172 domain-containing protein n=1 Tax=Prochlorococcus sp. MIT 1307 TaxID=3096219 RepID=UPI0039BF448B